MTEDDRESDNPLVMRIGMEVLEHLGLKMYSSLPAVISEYVANGWDAGAEEVKVKVPEEPMGPEYQITIHDDGIGMTPEEVNSKFLMVARKRRREEGDTTGVLGKKRRVMGRKGIGKLAGFGIAESIDIKTTKDGEYLHFRLNYENIQDRAEEADNDEKGRYKPRLIEYRDDVNTDYHGTHVVLSGLHKNRSQRPSVSVVRRKLARRFGVLDQDDFELQVNGEPISPEERDLKRTCQDDYVWEVGTDDDADIDGTVDAAEGYYVDGWIGTRKTTVDDLENGIAVMARGKLAQEPAFYGVEGQGVTGQHALSYMIGEINAEFVDEDIDLIATDRGSIRLESGRGKKLNNWLYNSIKQVCKEWAEKRRDDQIEKVKNLTVYEDRISNLSSREKRLADDFLSEIAKIDGYDEETLKETADYVATAVERKAFTELLQEIEENDHEDPHQIINLFQEWEVLDAVETFRRAEKRLYAIRELEYLIDVDIGEKDLQKFLGRNPWLLDPRWDSHEREVYFSDQLEEKFGDDETREGSDKRIDFVALGDSNTIKIIELKKPQATIGWNELNQIERYVSFAKELEASDTDQGRAVSGYIIGGKLAGTNEVRDKIQMLENNNMYFMTFRDLRRRAENAYEEFIEIVEEKYRVTGDDRLESRLNSLREKVEGEGSIFVEGDETVASGDSDD